MVFVFLAKALITSLVARKEHRCYEFQASFPNISLDANASSA
jgi:hypothetical protein